MRTTWVVAYDIREPKRLRRVYRLMLGFGDHVQYSVFKCDLGDTELLELRARLARLIHHLDDRIMFVDVGPADGRGRTSFYSLGQSLELSERCAVVM